MTDLFPISQEVFNAFAREARPEPHHQREALAAALRALADAVVPEEDSIVKACEFRRQRQHTRKQILLIATELESTND